MKQYYDIGETPARYGIGRKIDGQWYFLTEQSFSMSWETDMACAWTTPPLHYFQPQEGDILINFNKASSPVILGGRAHKGNYCINEIR